MSNQETTLKKLSDKLEQAKRSEKATHHYHETTEKQSR